jgi:hypothetical protein
MNNTDSRWATSLRQRFAGRASVRSAAAQATESEWEASARWVALELREVDAVGVL